MADTEALTLAEEALRRLIMVFRREGFTDTQILELLVRISKELDN